MFKRIKAYIETPAFEAVRFTNGPSNLFTELTTLCQTVFNALPKNILDLSTSECLAAVDTALDVSLFDSSFKELVKKELGYNISEVKRHNDSASIDLSILVLAYIPDVKKWQPYIKKSQASAATLSQLSTVIKSVYDDNTGAFNAPADLKSYFPATLFYSNSLWVIKKLWPDYDLTAENIAAAILHELGHIAGFIHDLVKMVEYNDIKTDIISYSKSMTSKEEMLKALNAYEESLNYIESYLNSHLNSQFMKKIKTEFTAYRKGIASCKTHITKEGVTDDTSTEFYYLSSILARYFDCVGMLSLRTVTDTFVTPLYSTRGERTADEFAARYGATKALVETLAVLDQIGTRYRNISYADTPSSWAMSAINLLNINATMLDIKACVISSSYDPFKERLGQIIKTTTAALKDRTLPDAVRNYYIQQIQESQKLLDDYSDQTYVKVRESLFAITERIGSIGKSPLTVFLAKLSQQYKPLQDWTDSLMRNTLGYQRARVDRLLK